MSATRELPARPVAFVVCKNTELGHQLQRLLTAEGYDCDFVTVEGAFDKTQFIETLLGSTARLVFAQDRMSPYSATELLLDLSHRGSVEDFSIVCLAQIYTWKQRTFFEERGGVHCIELDPGETLEEREDKIHYALGKVAKHRAFRESKAESRDKIIGYIDRFKDEGDFHLLAVRLFRSLGYDDVHLTHGPLELGKDLIFSELNKLGIREFTAVQIKLGDVHASTSKKGNVTALWIQSVEALASRVPIAGQDTLPDKYVVMASGSIQPAAEHKLNKFLRKIVSHRRAFFLGKEKIADLVVNYCPALRDELLDEIG